MLWMYGCNVKLPLFAIVFLYPIYLFAKPFSCIPSRVVILGGCPLQPQATIIAGKTARRHAATRNSNKIHAQIICNYSPMTCITTL